MKRRRGEKEREGRGEEEKRRKGEEEKRRKGEWGRAYVAKREERMGNFIYLKRTIFPDGLSFLPACRLFFHSR